MEKEDKYYRSGKRKSLFRRLFSPMRMAGESLIDGIVGEISKVVKDYITGVVSFFIAVFFFFFFWLSLNVLFVAGLNKYAGLDYFLSLAIVSLSNLLMSVVFLVAAKRKFTREK